MRPPEEEWGGRRSRAVHSPHEMDGGTKPCRRAKLNLRRVNAAGSAKHTARSVTRLQVARVAFLFFFTANWANIDRTSASSTQG